MFYLKKDYKVFINLTKIALIIVKLIIFLSKSLKSTKKNYYLIKLEVIYLI
jgi:hypothetical protein